MMPRSEAYSVPVLGYWLAIGAHLFHFLSLVEAFLVAFLAEAVGVMRFLRVPAPHLRRLPLLNLLKRLRASTHSPRYGLRWCLLYGRDTLIHRRCSVYLIMEVYWADFFILLIRDYFLLFLFYLIFLAISLHWRSVNYLSFFFYFLDAEVFKVGLGAINFHGRARHAMTYIIHELLRCN